MVLEKTRHAHAQVVKAAPKAGVGPSLGGGGASVSCEEVGFSVSRGGASVFVKELKLQIKD